MTARATIMAAWRNVRRVLCVLLAAGAASATASDRSGDLEARSAPPAPLVGTVRASMDATVKGAGFAVSRHVIAGGGGRSTGSAFAITGTIGQADADPLQPSSGGSFAITGGFWPGQPLAAGPQDQLFANGFEAQLPQG